MRSKFILVIVLISLVIVTLSCTQNEVEWKGTIQEKNGVTVVKNPKEPIYQEEVLIIEEELSIGDSEESEDYMFSDISHITVDSDGRIYILDRRESHVKLFDQNGKYIRTIGRKGQGPGEFNNPIFIYRPIRLTQVDTIYSI